MRTCLTCGQELAKTSAFCPACGSKVPPASQPTIGGAVPQVPDAPVRVEHVDPLASTSPASLSPARNLKPIDSRAVSSPVSPKAGTGLLPSQPKVEPASPMTPGRPSAQKPSTRGKTAPLSAMKNPPKIALVPPPAPAVPSQPQSPQAFAAAARVPPVQGNAGPPPPGLPAAGGSSPQISPGGFAPRAFPPGRRILVQWANGQRYPGVIEQINGAQCLVRFETGEQRWVEMRYVSPA
jgi:hypothetical protein